MIRAVLALLTLLLATFPADPRGSLPGNNPTLASGTTLKGFIANIGSANNVYNGGDNYIAFGPIGATSGYNPIRSADWLTYAGATGTVSNLIVYTTAAVTGAAYWTITLRQNSVDTSLSCKLDNTNTYGTGAFFCSDSTHSISISPTDQLDWRVTSTGAVPSTRVLYGSVHWVAGGSGKNEIPLYATGSNNATNYHALGVGGTTGSGTEADNEALIPLSGTIDQLYVYSQSGVGNPGGTVTVNYSNTFGSATATSLTCSATAVAGVATCNDLSHSVTVAAGGGLSVLTSWIAASGTMAVSVRFRPTVPGLIPVMSRITNPGTTTNSQMVAAEGGAVANTGTPILDAVSASNLYCWFATAPGGGATRPNAVNWAANAIAAPTVTSLATTLSGSNQTCTPDTTDTVTLPANSFVNNNIGGAGSPAAAANAAISWTAHQ